MVFKHDILLSYVIIFHLIWTNGSSFNFYLSKAEMKRLFDKNVRLDYVKNGEINYYALNASTPSIVPAEIDHIVFTWSSSSDSKVAYAISVLLDDEDALLKPLIDSDMPENGYLPSSEQDFAIKLRCNKPKPAVNLTIRILFSTLPVVDKNITTLLIKRVKVCPTTSKESRTNLLPKIQGMNIEKFGSAEHIFYVAIGCVFAFVILLATLLVAYFTRKKPARCVLSISPIKAAATYPTVSYTKACYENAHNPNSTALRQFSTSKSVISSRLYEPSELYVNSSSLDLPRVQKFQAPLPVDELEIEILTRQRLVDDGCVTLGQLEVEGTFGQYLHGFVGSEEDDEPKTVLIKATKTSAVPAFQIKRFLCNCLLFCRFKSHPNLLQPNFVCGSPWPTVSPKVCYVHAGFGNLKKFLQRCRNPAMADFLSRASSPVDYDKVPPMASSLVTQDLVKMALNILEGLSYLHRHCILHKDMATRNCVIDFDLVVQVCDDALSRDLFPQDYHCLGDNENRPLKWMSIEAIDGHDFSTASDTWAFGVTIWELVTLAQQPYADVDSFEIVEHLSDGRQRLSQPYNCPDELFMLMLCCWNNHPPARPTLDELYKALQDFCNQLNKFI